MLRLQMLALASLVISFSAAQSQQAPTPTLFPQTPFPLEGLRLALDAEGGVQAGVSKLVNAWEDQSGLGNHLTQVDGAQRPQVSAYGLAGRSALNFDGNDILVHPNALPSGSYTVVVLFALSTTDAANYLLASGAGWSISFMGTSHIQVNHEGSHAVSMIGVEENEPVILSVTYDSQSGTLNIHQDGVVAYSDSFPSHAGSLIELGGSAAEGTLKGQVANVLIYERVLASDEREQAEEFFMSGIVSLDSPLVTLDPLPHDGQIFQSDFDGLANVEISGTVLSQSVLSLEADLYADGQLVQTWHSPVGMLPEDEVFTISATLAAGLIDYDLEVFAQTKFARVPLARRDNLACGELLLVTGQSNAVAGDFHNEALSGPLESYWIRTYGTSTHIPGLEATDRHWDLADGDGWSAHAAVGQLALKTCSVLLKELSVPVGVLNGARNGTSIEDHQKNANDPTDQETLYGRLLKRAQGAGFANQARSMIWYQGERDSGNPDPYTNMFLHLHDDWMADYASLERIFLFQVRAGCNHDLINDGIREVLRQLPDSFPTVQLMSTTNADGHDSCHFRHVGYNQLGERVAWQLLRDQYGYPEDPDIDPPNLAFAQWEEGQPASILLTFREQSGSLVFEPGSEVDFLLDDGTPVVTGEVMGNTLRLFLAGPSTAQSISYVGHPLDGPFVHNLRGVGALTFFDQPILPKRPLFCAGQEDGSN